MQLFLNIAELGNIIYAKWGWLKFMWLKHTPATKSMT